MSRRLCLYTVNSLEDAEDFYFVWAYSFGDAMIDACKHYGTPPELFADSYNINLAYETSEDEVELDTQGRIV